MFGSNAFIFTVIYFVDTLRKVAFILHDLFGDLRLRVLLDVVVELQIIRTFVWYFCLLGKVHQQIVLLLKIQLHPILVHCLFDKDLELFKRLQPLLYHVVTQITKLPEYEGLSNVLGNKVNVFFQDLSKDRDV